MAISGTTWTHTYATEGTYSVNVTCYNSISVQSVVVLQYVQAPIVNLRLRNNGALIVSLNAFHRAVGSTMTATNRDGHSNDGHKQTLAAGCTRR